jgi:hypothetical protein
MKVENRIAKSEVIQLINHMLIGENTLHSKDNNVRHQEYARLFNSGTKLTGLYLLDRGHKNGLEYHVVFNNRICLVFNKNTEKYITTLYLRNGQLKRYEIETRNMNDFKIGWNYL